MICIFNRAKLFSDCSAEASANIWSELKKNGIEYEMKTLKNRSTLERNIHYNMGYSQYHGGMSGSSFGDELGYVYIIYVKKKDLERAKELCSLR